MSKKNQIGLDQKAAKELASKLNALLANFQVYYMNARGFHWNITGEKFFELHLKFEEIYNDAQLKIDEIAERVLTLGYTPMHSYTEYIANSSIKEATNVTKGKEALERVLEGISVLLGLERELLLLSSDAGDEGTNSLMSDYIKLQEKSVWMFNAFLK